ncbi:MAG: hypothetical protein LUH02_01070 [Erysipelotrichaceae bacterium]|nr:hypothetical protein [Erysipelotrichaceae bacterium]
MMRFPLKIIISSILFSVFCMFGFHLIFQSFTKNIYVCQVGIYSVAENKDAKISQLSSLGYDTYTYVKENQYYVLSMISEDLSVIENNASEVNGIVKTYCVDANMSYDELLVKLEEGEIND